MITVFFPVIIVANFNGAEFIYDIHRRKTVVNMVGFVLVPVHVKCGMLFFSLLLVKVMMINAVNSFLFQMCNHGGMVSFAAGPVPNGVAIKISY